MYRKVLPRLLRPLDRIHSLRERSLATADSIPAGMGARDSGQPRRFASIVEARRPDAVIVSPLVDAASDQVDVARAAQAAGIPLVAAISSWDNLTNKGHMRVVPDMVTVWNEHQKQEAVDVSRRAGRIASPSPARSSSIAGSSVSRASRARRSARWSGCPTRGRSCCSPDRRCSSHAPRSRCRSCGAGSRDCGASSDPLLRDAAVLVRPHPFNADAWVTADFSDLGPVAIWPRQRYTPAEESARTSFFDSLSYSAAIVGINTSAMIEGAILGRPVLSLLTPEFAGTQEGTLHFHYLLPENGGFLRVAHALDEHVAQLAEVLRHPELVREQTERFVRIVPASAWPRRRLHAAPRRRHRARARVKRPPSHGGSRWARRCFACVACPTAVLVKLFE